MTMEVETASSWEGNWRARVQHGLEHLGHKSVTSLCRSDETATFDVLIERLGGRIAPVQLLWIWREEADTQQAFDFFVRSTLARAIREKCPRGWKEHRDFDLTLAYTQWSGELGESYKSESQAVLDRLRSRKDLPADWLPTGASDLAIEKAFEGLRFPLHRGLSDSNSDEPR